ncbi:hypothetical protein [Pseudomonas sp. NPDC007930]|uniref:hypothetical protein n=1 Tax=Pseudomonas sp. NPDC007930 TaxID=3364417 RepID=UPI0036F16DEF
MMMVYYMVMTLCTGQEGCLDERKPVAFATQAECQSSISEIEPRRGVKYRCHRGPQTLISNDIRAKSKPHLATRATPAALPANAIAQP